MKEYTYKSPLNSRFIWSLVILLIIFWTAVAVGLYMLPGIKVQLLVLGALSVVFVAVYILKHRSRMRKFSIKSPVRVSGAGLSFNAVLDGEDTAVNIGWDDIGSVEVRREPGVCVITTSERAFVFARYLFRKDGDFYSFVNDIDGHYSGGTDKKNG